MRKRMFLAIVLSLCVVDFYAFGAVAQRGTRAANNATSAAQQSTASATNTSGQPMAARAGTRQKVVGNDNAAKPNTNVAAPATNGVVAARSGKKPTGQQGGKASSPIAARAGATKKVINMGTKVASATENTAVPQDCQDAFYGCMDTFCMLDNASGGRCLCNDRIVELDKVLEDILKLDEQSYIMATEGVERIQMGEAEEQIIARAKAVAEKTATKEKAKEDNTKKVRQLDLSIFNNNSLFNEADDDGIFNTTAKMEEADSFADKKGRELYSGAGKMCLSTMPSKCEKYVPMMQAVYAQKIKSDCMAYENSLKAQKSQSQQKLQTAQKALRDAALDEYKNQNKYATTGECAVAFAECMQTTAECGADYTGCVTLAAEENMSNTSSKTKAKQTTIKGAIAGADITLAASTLNQLLAKKPICERVTKQCVNSNKNDAVWNAFLRNAAPALKSAELIAEQNLRSDCIPKTVECFKKACKSNFGDGDSYDMCLSNPETYKSLCKIELTPCLTATGGSFEEPTKSTLWEGLLAALNAMKVDACTTQIKTCLTERCGEDFSGCIGLSTNTIGDLCPYQKLTACMQVIEKDNGNGTTDRRFGDAGAVRNYVVEIAKGLALQIDDALANACQNAVQESMVKVCGDTERCAIFDKKIPGKDMLTYQLCPSNGGYWLEALKSGNYIKPDQANCKDRDVIPNGEVKNYEPTIRGEDLFDCIKVDQNEQSMYVFTNVCTDNTYANDLVVPLNNMLSTALNTIKADPKVQYCMTGREVQGFNADNFATDNKARFPNLTDDVAATMAYEIYDAMAKEYYSQMTKIRQRIIEDMGNVETVSREDKCKLYEELNETSSSKTQKTAVYDETKKVCTVTTTTYICVDWVTEYARNRKSCPYWQKFGSATTKTINM